MDKRLLIGVVVLLGLGAAVFATTRSHQAQTTVEKPTASLPALKKDEITSIEITKPDKVTITLVKQGADWSLTTPVAAKADTSAVDSVLEKLSELEVAGVAATRKENHKRLQVDAETGIHVKAKGGEKVLVDLWVGAAKTGGTMVRAEGKDEVLTVKGSARYAFDKEVKLFRDRVITDLDPATLTQATIVSPKGKFVFEKPADKWQQAKGEKAIERFSDAKVQSLVSTVARMRAADFAEPGETDEAMGFTAPSATVTLTSKDGKTTVLELGREHGNAREFYLRVSGNPVAYRISKFTGERMAPEAKAFQEEEKKAGDAAPTPPPTAMGGEGQQIPPEILQQLQQQMAHGGGDHP